MPRTVLLNELLIQESKVKVLLKMQPTATLAVLATIAS